MFHGDSFGLLLGAVALGAVHGIEPGHGWPVAASYALDQTNKWVYGFAASFIIGVGHLVSSIAMVGVFFYAKSYFELTQVNEPITIASGIHIGGPVSLVAGILLIALGVREYFHGHSHGGHDDDQDSGQNHHGDPNEHEHEHDSDTHRHDSEEHHGHVLEESHSNAHEEAHSHDRIHSNPHDHDDNGVLSRLKGFVPFVGGHSHSHDDPSETADRGLLGIAWFAFVLGFAHEEEFEIIALCAGSNHCLELMSAYALTVILGIVGLTMLLIAGYQHSEEKVEQYTPYLPVFSAAVLVVMGVGFIIGLF